MASKEVKVKVSAIDAASASLKKIGVEADNLGESGQKFKVNWQAAGAAMTVAGGAIVGGLVASAKAAGDYGGQIFDATRKTGMSAESLTALKFAAEQSGVGFDMLQGAIARQARTANEAATGSKTAQEAYARLGVSVTDASGKMKDGNTLLLETADALKNIENPTQRSAMAMEVFGRSGAQMLPMLMEGSAGIADLEAKAKSLGLTMTDEMAKAADDAGDRMEAAQASIGMAWKNIGATVLPVVADVADKIAVVVGNVSRWAQDNPGLAKSLGTVALGVGAVMSAVGPLLTALPALKSGFELLQLVKTAGNVNALAGALGGGKGLLGVVQSAPGQLKKFGTSLVDYLSTPAGTVTASLAAITLGISLLRDMAHDARNNLKKLNDEIGITQGLGEKANVKGASPEAQQRMDLTRQIEEINKKRAEIRGILDQARVFGVMTGVGREIGGMEGIRAYEDYYKELGQQRDQLVKQRAAAGKRAAGGPVLAGSMYLVGEDGPEYFTPKASGQIIPREKTEQRRPSTRNVARGGERSQAMQAYLANKPPVTVTQQAAAQIAVTPPVQPQKPMRSAQTRTVQAAPSATASGYNAPRQRAVGGGDSIIIDLRLADGVIANVARQVLSSRDGRDIIIRTVKAQGARTVPQVAFGGYG